MSFTQTQLDALNDSIAKGVTEITYDGQTVKYRSIGEMLKLRKIIRDELGLNTARATRTYLESSRGV